MQSRSGRRQCLDCEGRPHADREDDECAPAVRAGVPTDSIRRPLPARVPVGDRRRSGGRSCGRPERTIIWGKIRRTMIGCVPGLALHLKRKHGLTGGCTSCGASCNLLFRCPHWDEESRLCSIYEDRPIVCRLFPITPSDLRDRDLAAGGSEVRLLVRPERSTAGTDRGNPETTHRVASGSSPCARCQAHGRTPRDVPGQGRSSRGE